MDILKAFTEAFNDFFLKLRGLLLDLKSNPLTGSCLSIVYTKNEKEHFDGVIKPSFFNAGNVPVEVDKVVLQPGVLLHWDYPFVITGKSVDIKFLPDGISNPNQKLIVSYGSYHTNKH